MKYRIVYQYRWFITLWLISLIYISNFILVKLPFVRVVFPPKDLEGSFVDFLLSFLPVFGIEINTYSLQTIVVWICGILFGPLVGTLAVSIYLLLGILGIPVFAGGGGFDYYKEPTFGYLISLPFNAFLSGWFFERRQKFLAVLLPIFITHLFGMSYLLFFKQSWISISWHLSFSMISYDLAFALISMLVLPYILFFLKEIFIQEIPVVETSKEAASFKDKMKTFK